LESNTEYDKIKDGDDDVGDLSSMIKKSMLDDNSQKHPAVQAAVAWRSLGDGFYA